MNKTNKRIIFFHLFFLSLYHAPFYSSQQQHHHSSSEPNTTPYHTKDYHHYHHHHGSATISHPLFEQEKFRDNMVKMVVKNDTRSIHSAQPIPLMFAAHTTTSKSATFSGFHFIIHRLASAKYMTTTQSGSCRQKLPQRPRRICLISLHKVKLFLSVLFSCNAVFGYLCVCVLYHQHFI